MEEKIQIPEGISCMFENNVLICKKDSLELSKKISAKGISITVKNNTVSFQSKKATKRERKIVHTCIKHIENIFLGLNSKFEYNLEAANVHFPMSLKVEGDKLSISNFLGEKIPRYAKILLNVDVQIKGQKITVSSHNKEAAGQTAANIENSTKVKNRDRRVFQDGIYITKKPGDKE